MFAIYIELFLIFTTILLSVHYRHFQHILKLFAATVKTMSFSILILLEVTKHNGVKKMANISVLEGIFFLLQIKVRALCVGQKTKWIPIFFILNNDLS